MFPASGDSSKHRLCFQVLESSGRYVPAFDAEAPALTFGGTTRGWRVIMDSWLRFIDGTIVLTNGTSGTLNDVVTINSAGETVNSIRFSGTTPTLNGLASGYEGRTMAVVAGSSPLIIANSAGGSVAGNQIVTGSGGSITLAADCPMTLRYSQSKWRPVVAVGRTPPYQDILFGAEATTAAAIYTRLGARTLNMADFPSNAVAKFVVDLENTLPASVWYAQARLFDITHNVEIASSLLDNTGAGDRSVAAEYTSSALTIGNASGNLRNDGSTLYSVQFRVGGSPTDTTTQRAIIGNARLVIT